MHSELSLSLRGESLVRSRVEPVTAEGAGSDWRPAFQIRRKQGNCWFRYLTPLSVSTLLSSAVSRTRGKHHGTVLSGTSTLEL